MCIPCVCARVYVSVWHFSKVLRTLSLLIVAATVAVAVAIADVADVAVAIALSIHFD